MIILLLQHLLILLAEAEIVDVIDYQQQAIKHLLTKEKSSGSQGKLENNSACRLLCLIITYF